MNEECIIVEGEAEALAYIAEHPECVAQELSTGQWAIVPSEQGPEPYGNLILP